jgi:DNA-binding MarR family transcriptional regulator
LDWPIGIIDALVRKGMVLQEHASLDRRLVICRLSSEGHLIGMLWTWG